MKVLIAEDDKNMSKIIKLYLEKEGYLVDIVFDGEAAVSYFDHHQADLIILDWMMPMKDGIEVCRELRLLQIPVKILMLTAKTTPANELKSLTTGADDYVRKPFDMAVLLIRIKKLCKMETSLSYQDLTLNPTTHQVTKNHHLVDLTKKEYELLKYFLINQKITLTREQILTNVWGIDYLGDERTVDTHIRRLRKKIGDSCIKTMIGTGYVLGDIHD